MHSEANRPDQLSQDMDDLQKAIAVRKWSHAQQIGGWGENNNSSEDPLLLLHRQRLGVPGSCRRFAYVLAGGLLAAGFDSRVVGVSRGLNDSDNGHTLVEVWISKPGKSVLMDSMFDTMFLVDGRACIIARSVQHHSRRKFRNVEI